uniref:Uncharacterized protein n=1 Tax=Physcomitrium patens TaxID=3218 RepID=A0A2K1K4K2_PHYPA|nr:hypothetical protein PHYPA_013179 [Physcomitrium patens]
MFDAARVVVTCYKKKENKAILEDHNMEVFTSHDASLGTQGFHVLCFRVRAQVDHGQPPLCLSKFIFLQVLKEAKLTRKLLNRATEPVCPPNPHKTSTRDCWTGGGHYCW